MEGPGVYLIKEKLSFLKGKKIKEVSGNTRENKELLKNKIIKDVMSMGKRLIFKIDKYYLLIHFLMYGNFKLNEEEKNKKERLRIEFDDGFLSFFNTSVKILKRDDFIVNEAIDIMSKKFDKKKAKEKIKMYQGYICDILLDQNVFAGLGNIIKNEALFRSRIHPLSISNRIKNKFVENLIFKIIDFSFLFYEVRKKGENLRNNLFVYGAKVCKTCQSKIEIKKLGITRRKTYFCNNCQIIF